MCITDEMGFEQSESYWSTPKLAEKDFYERLRQAINHTSLAKMDDLNGQKPWKVLLNETDKNIILRAWYHHWHSYMTDCGTEYDIYPHQIKIEKIQVNTR